MRIFWSSSELSDVMPTRACQTWRLVAIYQHELQIQKCIEKLANAIGAEVEAEQPITIEDTDGGRNSSVAPCGWPFRNCNSPVKKQCPCPRTRVRMLCDTRCQRLSRSIAKKQPRGLFAIVVAAGRASSRERTLRGWGAGWSVARLSEHMKGNGNVVCTAATLPRPRHALDGNEPLLARSGRSEVTSPTSFPQTRDQNQLMRVTQWNPPMGDY